MDREKAETFFLAGLLLVVGYVTYLVFRPLLDFIVIGFLLAFAFHPLYRWTLERVKRPPLAATLMILLVLVVVLLPLFVILGYLLQDIQGFIVNFSAEDTKRSLTDALVSLAAWFGVEGAAETIDQATADLVDSAFASLAAVFGEFARQLPRVLAQALLGVFVVFFTLYYGFTDGRSFVAAIRDVLPLHADEKDLLIEEIRKTTDGVFVGHILISLIQGAVGTIGFVLFGVPRPFFWGFVMVVLGILPIIGPVLVWLPVGIYLLVVGRTIPGVGVLIWGGILVSTIDNVLRPKLIGNRADIHPFLVLVGVLGGIAVFGFSGFIIGPLVISLFLASVKVFKHHWETDEGENWEDHEYHDIRAPPASSGPSESPDAESGESQ